MTNNKYFIINLAIYGSSMLENYLDKALKDVPYNGKHKLKGREGLKLDYDFILCKKVTEDETDQNYIWHKAWLEEVAESIIPKQPRVSGDMLYSVYLLLKDIIDKLTTSISGNIDYINEIDESNIDIQYTDGSFKKATNTASYACCTLNSNTENQLLEEYTGNSYGYDAYSGIINNATNNIGELTAIKVAANNFGKNTYQLIIADSEYSIKTFREWYYTWRKDGFKNYAGKDVKNKKLIQEIFNKLFSQNKIVLFKWTESHVGNAFNEKCDELAKHELGIDKH